MGYSISISPGNQVVVSGDDWLAGFRIYLAATRTQFSLALSNNTIDEVAAAIQAGSRLKLLTEEESVAGAKNRTVVIPHPFSEVVMRLALDGACYMQRGEKELHHIYPSMDEGWARIRGIAFDVISQMRQVKMELSQGGVLLIVDQDCPGFNAPPPAKAFLDKRHLVLNFGRIPGSKKLLAESLSLEALKGLIVKMVLENLSVRRMNTLHRAFHCSFTNIPVVRKSIEHHTDVAAIMLGWGTQIEQFAIEREAVLKDQGQETYWRSIYMDIDQVKDLTKKVVGRL